MGMLGKVTILSWNSSEKKPGLWWCSDSGRERPGTTRPVPGDQRVRRGRRGWRWLRRGRPSNTAAVTEPAAMVPVRGKGHVPQDARARREPSEQLTLRGGPGASEGAYSAGAWGPVTSPLGSKERQQRGLLLRSGQRGCSPGPAWLLPFTSGASTWKGSGGWRVGLVPGSRAERGWMERRVRVILSCLEPRRVMLSVEASLEMCVVSVLVNKMEDSWHHVRKVY